MSTKNKVKLAAVLSFAFAFSACVNHEIEGAFTVDCADSEEISYANDVQPIISTKCAVSGCHNANSQSLPNWEELDNVQANSAEIQRRITLPLTHPQKMPREGSISDQERQTLYCWIEQGALDN